MGDIGTKFIQDVNGDEMIVSFGTLDVATDWEGFQKIDGGAVFVATKTKLSKNKQIGAHLGAFLFSPFTTVKSKPI